MDALQTTFAVSGVQTWLWLPPLVAFLVSFFTSMVGVSGAFLLLPFQMSVLHYTAPSVSATNLVFNLVATPSGVYRYFREGRMLWPLTWLIVLGSLPGIAIGYFVRVSYLPDPERFKLFAGAVLLYIGYRVLASVLPDKASIQVPTERKLGTVQVRLVSLSHVSFEFQGSAYAFNTVPMIMLAFIVGIVGGIYGIGGGAIIAPFCVALFGLPVYVVAGAALAGTFATSVAGVLFYSVMPAPVGMLTQPEWALGLLFGVGGLAGMYAGAACQRFVPQRVLKLLLGGLLGYLAVRYLVF
jgi:uncharacterized protein